MKNIADQAKRLENQIDRFTAPVRSGKSETQTLESLARRILATPAQAREFIARGLLTPISTLTRGGDAGPWIFDSDELNDLRKYVLVEVVSRVIDESGDDEDAIQLGANHALAAHAAKHAKPAAGKKEFSANLGGAGLLRHFGSRDDEDSTGTKVAKTAGVLAGGAVVAGAGLAGLGQYQTYRVAKQIAQRHGQAAADAFTRNIGIGAKIKAGWASAKSGAAGAAGNLIGGQTGDAMGGYAADTAKSALANLRRAGGPLPAAAGAAASGFGKVAGTLGTAGAVGEAGAAASILDKIRRAAAIAAAAR